MKSKTIHIVVSPEHLANWIEQGLKTMTVISSLDIPTEVRISDVLPSTKDQVGLAVTFLRERKEIKLRQKDPTIEDG